MFEPIEITYELTRFELSFFLLIVISGFFQFAVFIFDELYVPSYVELTYLQYQIFFWREFYGKIIF